MVMAEGQKNFFEENFKQLHEDVRNLSKEFQAFLIRFAVFEEQKSANIVQMTELKAEVKTQANRIEQLENSLNYYKGAIAVLYVLIVPLLAVFAKHVFN